MGKTYEVRKGDNLHKISRAVYGHNQGWKKIFQANRSILADPNQLQAGMVLQVPQ